MESEEGELELLKSFFKEKGFTWGDDIPNEELKILYDGFEERYPEYIQKVDSGFYKNHDDWVRNELVENTLLLHDTGEIVLSEQERRNLDFESMDIYENNVDELTNIFMINEFEVDEKEVLTKDNWEKFFIEKKKYIYFKEGKDIFDVIKFFEEYPEGVIVIQY